MKKRTLALVGLSTVLALLTWASPVDVSQARNAAAAFVQQKQATLRTSGASTSTTLQTAANTGYYYVFNVGDNNGFVIVSGDDRTNPILGYSDEGHFDAAKVPANMQGMLDSYNAQLKALATMNDVEAATRLAAPRRTTTVNTRNSIAPIITTKWDQATPYWNQCPQFMNSDNEEDGYELAYTGCVATAMAQIMKYYNWPAQCTQTIPSYQVTYYDTNVGEYGQFYTDPLEPMAFDWAHMKDSYTGAEDEVYTDAVSWLMLYVGCAAHMQYGMSASGTSDPYIPKAFQNYFDYDAELVYRSDYDQPTWEEMIYQELVAGRPMVYNGRAGSGGGHSFVCDGYEYGDYYHINWGWGGMGNGYFVLSVMNPQESGIGGSSSSEGYNIDQTAIIGIKPGYSGPSSEVEHILTVFNMYYTGSRTMYNEGRGFSLYKTSRYIKVTAEDHIDDGTKYKRGIALYDSNDNFIELIMSTNYYTSSLSITDRWPSDNDTQYHYFGKNVSNGTYKIVPVCQMEGNSDWTPMLESDRYYIALTVSGDVATVVDHPIVNLQSTAFEFTGGEKVGTAEQCHVTVKNNSADRFSGKLYLFVSNEQIDEYGEYTTVVETEIPANGEKVVTFNFTPQNAGTKTAYLSTYDNTWSSSIPGTGSVTITSDGSSDFDLANLSVVIKAENAVGNTIYDSFAHFSATITNSGTTDYNKYVLAPLFIVQDGKGSMVTYKQTSVSIPAGQSQTLYFDFDNLAYGSTYALNIYARNNVPMDEEGSHVENIVKPGESVYYNIEPGIVVWSSDCTRSGYQPVEGFQVPADAVAVSLEGVTLSNIVAGSNPNTIYILDENATVPANLNGKNVVKGQNATSIVLEDGYPYLVPQSVNAAQVTYNRTFTQARQADQRAAWSTMVLPFAPTSVSIDGRTPTNGTDYWTYNFPREEDGSVVFDAVTTLQSNVPYLVAVAEGKNMTGKVMSWSAQNVTLKAEPIAITSGESYMLSGTYIPISEGDIYTMDAQGSRFVLHDTPQTVAPFRAYFKAMQTVDATEILCPGTTEVTPTYKRGDVNGDGEVDVADINILVNIVLGKDSADNYDGRAYVTEGDTTVDVSDVNDVVNIILGKE